MISITLDRLTPQQLAGIAEVLSSSHVCNGLQCVDEGCTAMETPAMTGGATITETPAMTGAIFDRPPGPADAAAANRANGSVELDTLGRPWDERINTGNKSKLGSGAWKIKPKTDKAFLAEVHAAQDAAGYGPGAVQQAPVQQPAMQQPQVQQAPVQPTYSGIVSAIVEGVSTDKFTASQATELLNNHGVADTNALATRDDVFPQVAAALQGLTGGS